MSHMAVHWAAMQRDLPLDQRMVLIALADRHCPDKGCRFALKQLAEDLAISEAHLLELLARIKTAGKISRCDTEGRYWLAFEKTGEGA